MGAIETAASWSLCRYPNILWALFQHVYLASLLCIIPSLTASRYRYITHLSRYVMTRPKSIDFGLDQRLYRPGLDHIPSSFSYYIKCFDDTVYEGKPVTYTAKNEDDDVAQIFLEKLEEDLRDIWRIKKYKDPADMIFTEEDKPNFDKATKCHICGKYGFVKGDEKKNKVRDHCHLTNRFRGAAHVVCNRNYRIPKFIPVSRDIRTE